VRRAWHCARNGAEPWRVSAPCATGSSLRSPCKRVRCRRAVPTRSAIRRTSTSAARSRATTTRAGRRRRSMVQFRSAPDQSGPASSRTG